MILSGLVAGLALGYVLQRGQLCFHAMFASASRGNLLLLRGWLLGVAVAAVGLSSLYLTGFSEGLNRGLPLRPVANVLGGLMIGAGMAVARSCVSGLFYKLGAGMVGAVVGIGGWIAGELAVRRLTVPGPEWLPGGDATTIPDVLGVPRLGAALVFLALVAVVLVRRPGRRQPEHAWQWSWPTLGLALGAATIAGWVLAAAGDADFGPSTVGASASVRVGDPNWWLLAFLVALIPGATLAARLKGGFWLRGEHPVRYGQLALGGALLGAGGWIAGGCNLGHGLSGVAQLNVSSWLVVAAIAVGVAAATRLRLLRASPTAAAT